MPRFLFLKLLTIKLIVCSDTRPARMSYDTYHEHTRNENVAFPDIDSRVTLLSNKHDNVIVCWDDIFYECKTDRHELCVENDINEDTVTANFDLTLFEPSTPSKGAIPPETQQVGTYCICSGLPTYTSDQSNLYTEQNSQTIFYQNSSIATSSLFSQKLHSRIHQSGNNDHAHMHAATNHSSLNGRADIEEIYKTESHLLTNKHNPDANLAEYASSYLDIMSLQQDKSYLAPEAHVMASTSQEQQISTKQTDIAFIAARKRCGMDMQQTSSSNKRIKSCESQNVNGQDDCHLSITRKSDPSKCTLKSTLMNHIEFRNNLYIQKLNNELIPIKDINEAKNAQMSESTDRRIIFSRKFSENELLSFDIIKIYYFLYVLSSIKYEANRAIINIIIEIYAGKMNMRPFFHNIHTFDTVISKSLETYPNKPIDIKEHHQYSLIHVKQCHMNINSAKNYAEKNVLFIEFVKETILDQTDSGHYILKPHMWKLQMYMPEIGPYFNWRFYNLEPLTYNGIPFYFDFDTEIEIIQKLLEEHFGNKSSDEKNSASSINRGVAYKYQKLFLCYCNRINTSKV